MKKYLLILAAMAFVFSAVAGDDNQITLDAQLRARGEYNNGAIVPRYEHQSPSLFVNERARVTIGYQRKNLELKVGVQHTGVWGQDDIKDRAGRVAMNEAWAKLKFGKGGFAQIGRQQLVYDDERLLGGLDWNVAGNWHDALRFGYDSKEHKVHAIFAINQSAENVRGNYYSGKMPYKWMQTLWYHYQGKKEPFGISLLFMNIGREAGEAGHGKSKFMQTFGTHITYKPSIVDLTGTFYYQTGKTVADDDIAAWMASARLAVTPDKKITLHAAYDYLSGNGENSTKENAFDPLYGTHHKFYGSMDYFTGKQNLGLQDIQAGITARVSPKVSLQGTYHYLLTAEKVAEDLGKGLGHEIDLQLTAKLMKDVTLMAGYSFMCGTESMDVVKGGYHKSWQDWAWISLNINPRILSKKW